MRELEELRRLLTGLLAEHLGSHPDDIDPAAPLDSFGLSSRDMLALAGRVEERTGRAVAPTPEWRHPTLDGLAAHIADAESAPLDPPRSEAAAPAVPVAIVGASCRLPGGVGSLSGLRDLLVEGRDAVGDVPADRWDRWRYYDDQPRVPGRTNSRWGGFLDDVTGFDARYFGIPEDEAGAMDPQHRLLLEVGWEALEHAGTPPGTLAGEHVGVFAGLSHYDRLLRAIKAEQSTLAHSLLGSAHSAGAGRIAHLLDVHGPALAVDTACSSGLAAVHLAMESLARRECRQALAGAATVHLDPQSSIAFSQWGALSPTGRCRAFDAGADGFVRSEGCAVVVLKRLDEAREDGDRILGVLRGSAVNHDGRTIGLMAPSSPAQVRVMRQALERAAADPDDVGLVEAHGTGTPVGDPIEFEATAAVYGAAGPCALGAAKTNLGHTEAAAGLVGLLKALLALEDRSVPANLHFRSWNPVIDRSGSGLYIPTRNTPSEAPLAAVSSFGVGGTNGHVIVERRPDGRGPASGAVAARPGGGRVRPPAALYPLSAGGDDALAEAARRTADWLEGPGSDTPLPDVGHTLANLREHRSARLAVAAGSRAELVRGLRAHEQGRWGESAEVAAGRARRDGPAVWVFSGQGSQWAGMGAGPLAEVPPFAEAIARLDPLIAAESGFSVTEALRAPTLPEDIGTVQPALFAMQVGLAAAWRSWGMEPAAVIGHSMGEAAAAVVAGGLSEADGVRVVCRRSRLMAKLAGTGAMAAVELPAERVGHELARGSDAPDVAVAVVSSPGSTVVSGDAGQIEALIARWQAQDIPAHRIAVDVASHSPLVDPVLDGVVGELSDLAPATPRVPILSTVEDDPRAVPSLDAAHWAANLRRPVRFAAAVEAAAAAGHRTFIEMAPHPLLTRSIEECLARSRSTGAAIGAMRRDRGRARDLLAAVGTAHCHGARIDWEAQHRGGGRAELPGTPWNHQHFPLPTPDPSEPRSGDGHVLLAEGAPVPEAEERRTWTARVGTRTVPWLADHRINGVPFFPTAGHVEIALEAACRFFSADPHRVEIADLRLHREVLLAEDTELVVDVRRTGADEARFEALVRTDDAWARCSTALLRLEEPRTDAGTPDRGAETRARCTRPVAVDGVYEAMRRRGLDYGPAFQALDRVLTTEGTVAGEARGDLWVPAVARHPADGLRIHPVLLDGCLQTIATAAFTEDAPHGLVLPVAIGSVRLHRRAPTEGTCLVQGGAREPGEAGCVLVDEDGAAVLTVEGVRGQGPEERFERRFRSRLAGVGWDAAPPPAPAPDAPVRWLVAAADPDASETRELRCELVGQGRAVEVAEAARPVFARHLAAEAAPEAVVLDARACTGTDPRRARSVVEQATALIQEAVDRPLRLCFLTRLARTCGQGDLQVAAAPLRALARVAAHEHPELCVRHIDVDGDTPASAVAAELLGASGGLGGTVEDEVVWRGGARSLPRLRTAPLRADERRSVRVDPRADRAYDVELGIGRSGDLSDLELRARPRRAPGPGEIGIRVHAASLNYADVLNAMGLYATVDGGAVPLGFDGAGEVEAVGPGVTGFAVDDRVAFVTTEGAMADRVTVAAGAAFAVPEGFDTGQAAALPGVYATAWYGLMHLARIREGETVLVHSASGGVGLAAAEIARSVGARVLATAGSEEKRSFLRERGIEHVVDSRGRGFAEQVHRITAGRGVDAVLSALPGPAQRAGLECLAAGGRFIELGKRDIYGGGRLDLAPFRRNLTFASVDMGYLGRERPDVVERVLAEVGEGLAAGRLGPLPHTAFPMADADEAFRLMASARHVGKLVLTLPTEPVEAVMPPERAGVAAADGAYIITGGLGGLGLLLARHLIDGGAGRVVLNGRSAPGPEAGRVLEELRGAGADIDVVTGDAGESGTAEALVCAATARGHRLRGVAHAAAVVEDALLTRLDPDVLDRAWGAKTDGAWLLHRAVGGAGLDWWLNFSSAAALLGSPGQAAYATANAWLEAFSAWQRAEGVPAYCIAWGAWAEVGAGRGMAERGHEMIEPAEGIAALDRLLRHDRPWAAYLPLQPDLWRSTVSAAERSSFFADVMDEGPGEDGDGADTALLDEVRQATPDRAVLLLQEHLAGQLRTVLRLGPADLDAQTRLSDLGADSLSALELRTRVERSLGVRIPAEVLTARATIADLASVVASGLGGEGAGPYRKKKQ